MLLLECREGPGPFKGFGAEKGVDDVHKKCVLLMNLEQEIVVVNNCGK